jgi:hypothetical protein
MQGLGPPREREFRTRELLRMKAENPRKAGLKPIPKTIQESIFAERIRWDPASTFRPGLVRAVRYSGYFSKQEVRLRLCGSYFPGTRILHRAPGPLSREGPEGLRTEGLMRGSPHTASVVSGGNRRRNEKPDENSPSTRVHCPGRAGLL